MIRQFYFSGYLIGVYADYADFTPNSEEDLVYWRRTDKKKLKRRVNEFNGNWEFELFMRLFELILLGHPFPATLFIHPTHRVTGTA